MQENITVPQTMALVNQRSEQFMWMLLVSMYWKRHWLMLKKMHFPYIFCVVMYCTVNYFYWCLARYIHAGLHAQFFKKSFNCEMVAIKQTNKNSHWREHIFMLHYIFGEPDDMIATLSFANLVCSLLCWFKDCNNGEESEYEETPMSKSRSNLLWSCWDLHVIANHV